jgi:hypothetical protein
MATHSLELLHPTEPPGRRAFRLVLLLVLAFVAVLAGVSVVDPVGASSAAPPRVAGSE